MKQDVRKTIMLPGIAILIFSALSYPAPAAGISGKKSDMAEKTVSDRKRTSTDRQKHIDRQARFITDTCEDLNYSISLASEDINRLNGLADAMTPLEPPKREFDIRGLLEWYYTYSDRNKEMAAECKDLQAGAAYPGIGTLYADLADDNRNSVTELNDMIRSYRSELKKLFVIVDRRRFLNDRLRALNSQLSEIEEKMKHIHPREREKMENRNKAGEMKRNIRVVQTELVSLVDIKEELLKHYVLMIEMGRDQAFWLGLKQREYIMLANLSRVSGSAGSNDSSQLAQAYRGVVRGYDEEISKLERKIDELDRKRSGVTPVGSFRDLDRSAEISDFYMNRRQRYSDYIDRLKTRIGGAESEISQLTSRS